MPERALTPFNADAAVARLSNGFKLSFIFCHFIANPTSVVFTIGLDVFSVETQPDNRQFFISFPSCVARVKTSSKFSTFSIHHFETNYKTGVSCDSPVNVFGKAWIKLFTFAQKQCSFIFGQVAAF